MFQREYKLLLSFWLGEEPFSGAPELFDRLELHIKGSKHSIGAQRVVLKAKPTAN